MNTKKIISRIVLGMIGMTTFVGQCNASQGMGRMSDKEFCFNLGWIGRMIDRIGNPMFNDFDDETLIKMINATLEEYIPRKEANDFYANSGHFNFWEGLMRMLAHYPESLSQTVKDKVPEFLKDLYPDEDIEVNSGRDAAQLIFDYIYINNPESLGEYHL
ncbi:MAG: hypothetical protein LBI77_03980 [Puniceicoccales bacterium]|nr:hypothetical protein [Puniceicoccales bacterium]